MTDKFALLWRKARARASGPIEVLRRDERGVTAVEFGFVAMPFLMMLFGIIAVGLFFFTTFSLENAVEQASRPLRTGEALTSVPVKTKEQFKQDVCNLMYGMIDCTGKLRVNVQQYNVGDAIVPPACIDAGGSLVGDPADPTNNVPGAANKIMLVTACLQWDLAGKIPFLTLTSMSNGAALIQASTTFKIEPFN
jgi:Flp pilus assembly protein TadG